MNTSSNIHEVMHVSEELRHELVNAHIEPFYKTAVERTIHSKFFWRSTGVVLEATSKILIAAAGILSFSTSYFDDHRDTLSFASGSVSCLSLGAMQVASFAYKEHKRQTKELNQILQKLRIDTVPELLRSVTPLPEARSMTPPEERSMTPPEERPMRGLTAHAFPINGKEHEDVPF